MCESLVLENVLLSVLEAIPSTFHPGTWILWCSVLGMRDTIVVSTLATTSRRLPDGVGLAHKNAVRKRGGKNEGVLLDHRQSVTRLIWFAPQFMCAKKG
ncbi:hypothetical protein DMENIID0001_088620 [Sergentomyia squamirostris]